MRRSIRLALAAAGALTLMITAVALAAPHSGKWHGQVLLDAPGKSYDGAKVNYGYAPNDHASVVRFKVAKGSHKLKAFKVTLSTCGPPAVPISVASVKIKKNGKFAKTAKIPVAGGSSSATLKLRGKLSGSKGSGKLSLDIGCTSKFRFKLKH
jgi:hypothetical protein